MSLHRSLLATQGRVLCWAPIIECLLKKATQAIIQIFVTQTCNQTDAKSFIRNPESSMQQTVIPHSSMHLLQMCTVSDDLQNFDIDILFQASPALIWNRCHLQCVIKGGKGKHGLGGGQRGMMELDVCTGYMHTATHTLLFIDYGRYIWCGHQLVCFVACGCCFEELIS